MPGSEVGRSHEETISATGSTVRTEPRGENAARRKLERGDAVGHYLVLDVLGAGAVGVVYAAYDPRLDRRVALKVLQRHDAGRLLAEARALARVSHPNVITVHDVGERDGRAFIAMEYVDGVTLREFLGEEQRQVTDILRVFLAAGRGLAAAHARGLVHRDFKPDNVMIDAEGKDAPGGPARVRVLDFGLAREDASRGEEKSPGATAGFGTPAYMAPEQFSREEVGPAADQFAFCVALFEALHGARPFAGDSVAELAASVVEGRRRETELASEVPGFVNDALGRGLSVDPVKRWPSMEALLEQLKRDPTRRRRLWIGVLAALAIGGGVAGMQAVDARRKARACDARGESMDAIWSTERAASLSRVFADADAEYVARTWVRVEARFDAFAQAWAESVVSGCRSAETFAAATDACLDEQRARLEATLAELELGTPAAIQGATDLSTDLPEPTRCLDPEVARRQLLLPQDGAQREAVLAVKRGVTAVEVMIDAGRVDAARDRADALLAEAQATEWKPAVAVARVALALTLREGGDRPAAVVELEQAFAEAGVAGDDMAALYAVTELVYVVGHLQAHPEPGLVWGAVGQMLLDRSGLPEHHRHARRLLTAIGAVQATSGAHEDAVATFRRLYAVTREALGDDHPTLSTTLGNLGAALAMLDQKDEGIELLERAIEVREQAYGAEDPGVMTALMNLGSLLVQEERYEQAVAALERAHRLAVKHLGEEHVEAMILDGKLAYALALLDRPGAMERLERAVERQRRALVDDHPALLSSENELAYMYRAAGRDKDAIAVLVRVTEVGERRSDGFHPMDYSGRMDELAHAYHDVGDLDAARAAFVRGVERLDRDNARGAAAWLRLRHGEFELAVHRPEAALELCEAAKVTLSEAIYVAAARACVASARAQLPRGEP